MWTILRIFLKSLYTERENRNTHNSNTELIKENIEIKYPLSFQNIIIIVSEENLPFYSGDIVKIWRYVVKKQITLLKPIALDHLSYVISCHGNFGRAMARSSSLAKAFWSTLLPINSWRISLRKLSDKLRFMIGCSCR